MNKYFFILGNNKALSVAELLAALDLKNSRLISPELLFWETESEIVPENLIKRLGGVIKIGVFLDKITETKSHKDALLPLLGAILTNNIRDNHEGKFCFGVSVYGESFLKSFNIGLELKKNLKEKGISSRLVTSRDSQLSSVVVTQNKLIKKGVELVLIKDGGEILLGKTLAVQPFKDLSKRDYGRPARDDESGMIPPKLAQIMLNLAEIESDQAIILDPFCGSGTILMEAALLGYENLAGTDLSPKAVADTKENLAWLKDQYDLKFKTNIFLKNATKLAESFKENSVDAVITEPYLGPQRGWHDLKEVSRELESLYGAALKEFAKILKPHGRVVMIWPSFFGSKPISPDYYQFKIVSPIPKEWPDCSKLKLSPRNTLIYGRPGQKVFREIVILEKK